jgi:two-component system, cell cycle response regulator
MLTARVPPVARVLLAAASVCLGTVLLRNLGVVSPVLPGVWEMGYNACELLAIAACALRAARTSGAERGAWIVLTCGLLAFAAGDIYWSLALDDLASPPYPSLADAGYLSIYPAAFVALVLLLRARGGRPPAPLWLDGLVCGLAVAAVGAALALDVVASTNGTVATVATNLAYPLGDLTLLAFVTVVMIVTGRRSGSTWRLLALAFAVWAVADTVYLYQAALGSYREFTILDTAWPAAYVLIAFAAWRPVRRLDARRVRGATLVLPAAMTLVALALLMADHYRELNDVALWLACGAVAIAVARFALTFRDNLRMLRSSEKEAFTDALTGLGNRRALLHDLDHALSEPSAALILLDLDGFKTYNDRFGHYAGDALLVRLGRRLADDVGTGGTAYRMGGDEFCVLVTAVAEPLDTLTARVAAALSELGEQFAVGCSHGTVLLGVEAHEPSEALRLADQRMYAHKRSGRPSSDELVHRVLLHVAAEHDGELRDHVDDVAELAEAVGRELGLDEQSLTDVRRAATLHDIGKIAIPDAILQAPRALTEDEWQYMRRHTLIGERIINAAPGLDRVARMVRSSHERYDGAGYPDALAGDDIPLGSRIVAVCDAYDAMVTDRAYRAARPPGEALAELVRCAGTQFDPRVVAAFAAVVAAPSGVAG